MSTAGRIIALGMLLTALAAIGAGSIPDPDDNIEKTGSDARCLSCHRIESALSHPVGVFPSMQVPTELPLVAGRIGCVTCHTTSHGVSSDGRSGRPTAECSSCHDNRRRGRRDIHAVATTRAHLSWRSRPVADDIAMHGSGPDAESQRCLGCHDGAVASGVGERFGPGGPSGTGGFERMTSRHPIGGLQYPRDTGDTLVHPDSLDPRIRLFDGRVGCGSCHSPYAGVDALLVMSNERSALCLTCHDFSSFP